MGIVNKLNTFLRKKKPSKQIDFLDVKKKSLLPQLALSADRQVYTQSQAGLILFVDKLVSILNNYIFDISQ